MTIQSYSDQLEEVQAAITAVLSGAQSYSIGDGGMTRELSRASLDSLQVREEYLRKKVQQETRGGMSFHQVEFL